MIKVLQEITEWEDCNIPSNVYHVNGAGKLIAFENSQGIKKFAVPMSFDRRGRKFVTLRTYDEELPAGARKVKGTNGKVYIVHDNSCTCTGFKFRGHCKHLS